MKRNIVIAIICVLIILVGLFFSGIFAEKKQTFKGPQGAPFVRGPFGPPPSQ